MPRKKSSNSAPAALKISDSFMAAVKTVNLGTAADPDEYFSALCEVNTGVDDLMRQARVRRTQFNHMMFYAMATSEEWLTSQISRDVPIDEKVAQEEIDRAIGYLDPDLHSQ